MWRWVVALLIVALQLNVMPVYAQATPTIDTVEVNIWPEYDREGILVFYRITLNPDVSLPAPVAIRIPRSANGPASVQMEDWDGLLYDLKYTTESQGDWLLVKFIAPRQRIWIEYNDPRLKIEDQQRQFKYVWPGDYQVNQMFLRILEPVNASQMTFMPGMGQGAQSEDGKMYFSKKVDQVPAGVTVTLNVTYQKPDYAFAATPLPVYPVKPVTPRTAGRLSRNMIGWLLGILGALLIAGGIIWFLRSGRALPEAARKHNGGSAAKKEPRPPSSDSAKEEIYCRQCGRRASPGDTYCRTCGTHLEDER